LERGPGQPKERSAPSAAWDVIAADVSDLADRLT
jgi:hypothetical protein